MTSIGDSWEEVKNELFSNEEIIEIENNAARMKKILLDEEITAITDRIIKQLSPLRIYLFGSFADGSFKEDSDYDFYIVVDDRNSDWYDQTTQAYHAIRSIRTKPVDVLVATNSTFEKRIKHPSIEREVFQKGILLYEQNT